VPITVVIYSFWSWTPKKIENRSHKRKHDAVTDLLTSIYLNFAVWYYLRRSMPLMSQCLIKHHARHAYGRWKY